MKKIIEILHKVFTAHHVFITMGIVFLLAVVIGYGEFRLFNLDKEITLKNKSLSDALDLKIVDLERELAGIVEQNNLLNSKVQDQMSQASDLLDQVEQVSDTAKALDKLSKVDPQLLQKYSKVYFLNEHYIPARLEEISDKYVLDKKRDYELQERVNYYLEKMFEDALDDDVDLRVVSAYRSFGDQAVLKSNYQVVYGVGTANQFSADQGYSEHQLGTTVDITTPELGVNYESFDTTPAYKWLKSNAYKYGFILSYPKNNAYYVYEPWHWRFVGVDLANRLQRKNEFFYDVDQRIINNYLGVFFD